MAKGSLTNVKGVKAYLNTQIQQYYADIRDLQAKKEECEKQILKTLGALELCRHLQEEVGR